MQKKLSTVIFTILFCFSFVGCQKEAEQTSTDTSTTSTLVEDVTNNNVTDQDDDQYIIEHKDNEAINSMNLDGDDSELSELDEDENSETDETDEVDEEETTDETDEEATDEVDEEAEIVELEPIVDEDFSYYGHIWTQPEDLLNYKITISNTGDEPVTLKIFYGKSVFEHEVTVSSMASKTVRVENSLPGEHTLEFDTEEVDLSGTIQIWVSDEAF